MNKKIHYIWLGEKKKPRVIRKCIKTWKKHLPDWEIIEWNESNLNLNVCEYCTEAYNAHKYAFAADVLRFDILYREGGLYFDTDVKLLKNIQPLIDECEAFCGFEFSMVAPGLVLYSKNPGDKIIYETLEMYKDAHFIENGVMNTKVVGEYFSDILARHGFNYKNEKQICDSFTIFPSTFFCPTDGYGNKIAFSNDTYSIHLYAGSWLPMNKRIVNRSKKFFYKHIGLERVQKMLNKLRKWQKREGA